MFLSALAGATAVWVNDRAQIAERENPARGRFMHLDGVRLHYQEFGSAGPVIAMLHGNALHAGDFIESGLVDRLARDHRVILFDRPGCGHSSRPRDRLWTAQAQAALLHRALVALRADRPLVLGHSMGAQVALAMALDYPASVAGLVLLGGFYYPQMRIDSLMVAPVATPGLGDAMRYTVAPVSARLGLARSMRQLFAPHEVPPGYVKALSRELLVRPVQLRADAEDGALMLPQARLLAPRYAQLRLPVSVITGERDRVVDPASQSRRLAADLPNSRLQVVPGLGHMAHHAAADLIESEIEAVLADARTPRLPGRLSEAAALVQFNALPPQVGPTASGNPPA